MDSRGGKTRLLKAAILRDLVNGITPRRVQVSDLHVLLGKDESVIWAFNDVEFFELKTRRTYHGRSNGVSIRIAKGVYYRTSSFKGYPVETQGNELIGKGSLVITNKNVFLIMPGKTIKIGVGKLTSLTPYSDGIGLQRDTVRASSFTCVGLDGWFAYNVVSNLTAL
jgi:hypothetical protein